jgi:hypothetical protein
MDCSGSLSGACSAKIKVKLLRTIALPFHCHSSTFVSHGLLDLCYDPHLLLCGHGDHMESARGVYRSILSQPSYLCYDRQLRIGSLNDQNRHPLMDGHGIIMDIQCLH